MKYPATVRRSMIITAAVEVANADGLGAVTRHSVAARCDVSARTVRQYFPRIIDLLTAVIGDDRTSRAVTRQGEGMGLSK